MSDMKDTVRPDHLGVSGLDHAYQYLLRSRPGFLASESGGELSWLRDVRNRDAARWRKMGLPKRQSERWRYMDLKPLESVKIHLPAPSTLPRRELFPSFSDVAAEIVFLNGHFVPEWSNCPETQGVSISLLAKTFAECLEHGWSRERQHKFSEFRKHVETADTDRETVFASMNTSFVQDAVLVNVDSTVTLEKPIVICYFTDASLNLGAETTTVAMTSPRVFVHLQKLAQASVLECFHGRDGATYMTNAVTDLRVDQGASLSHCKVQLEGADAWHLGTTRVHQKRDSKAETHQFTFGAKLSRNDLHIGLEDEGAEALLNGLYVASAQQYVDNYTLVDHISAYTTSEQVYKGLLDGEARAVFNGHVRIFRDAQKSNATQLNNNLVLSKKAEINTRPELEIDADDVKAAHGATIGQLDPEHVFYLQARAIPKEQAVAMLAKGFAQDIAFRVRDPHLRRIMIDLVGHQMAGTGVLHV